MDYYKELMVKFLTNYIENKFPFIKFDYFLYYILLHDI